MEITSLDSLACSRLAKQVSHTKQKISTKARGSVVARYQPYRRLPADECDSRIMLGDIASHSRAE